MAGRIYSNVKEAVNETQRELAEMGILVAGHSYQDQLVEGKPEFVTKELQAYDFTIAKPHVAEALDQVIMWYGVKVEQWVRAEFDERVSIRPENPGTAWGLRPHVWSQFLERDGEFAYTYSERMGCQLNRVIGELREHPQTRQAVIEIHTNHGGDIDRMGGRRRIPCSMFYQFMIRNGAMDCIYVMRSSDFLTHFVNDITLAIMLQDWMRSKVDNGMGTLKMGNFTMFISSLHCFQKDIDAKGIF